MKKLLFLFLTTPFALFSQSTLPASWSFINPAPSGAGSSNPTGPATTYTGINMDGWSTKLDAFVGGTTPFVYATGSDGNAACRLDGQDEYVQLAFAEKPGVLTYSIRGTAISPNPPFSGSFKIQESITGATWTDLKVHTSMTSGFANESLTPATTSRFIRFYYTTKVSGSNVALDNIILAKAGPTNAASIQVKQGTKTLANGSDYINGKAATTVFTIQNLGLAEALTFSSITLTEENAGDYTLVSPPSTIVANGSANLTVNFAPASNGTSKATILLASNDLDNPSFLLHLYGIGGNFATEPVEQITTCNIHNVTTYGFNLSYVRTPDAENFLVLRKKGGTISDVPVDGQTYNRGDVIGTSQVAYIGHDTLVKPNNIIANTEYQFKIFPFNGPATFENYLSLNAKGAGITTPNGGPKNYYAGINSSSANFVSALSAKIAAHDTIFYGNYTPTLINNFESRDTTNDRKVVTCVYTGLNHIYNEPFVWWGNVGSGELTREHTYAQSWMPTRNTPGWPSNGVGGREFQEYSDLHHLFPANQLLGNNVRSNNPLGEVVTVVSQNGEGKIGTDANGKTVYEPRDSHKGDAARALFYMCVAYNGIGGKDWSLGTISAAQQDEAILKKWHFQDLPDAYEIARHEYIVSLQKNRNPFIDSVNLVCRINFSNLTWIAAPDVNCGVVIPSLTILSPVGGEVWTNTGLNTITWASSAVDSVNIELLINDTFNRSIGKAVASLGSYTLSGSNLPKTNNAKIKLRSTNNSLTSTSPAVFIIGLPSGLNHMFKQPDIAIFPNPTLSKITVDILESNNTTSLIMVTDITGRVLLQKEMNATTTIELSNQGIYFVKVQTEKGSIVKKIVVQ
jgi:hypothetical protein